MFMAHPGHCLQCVNGFSFHHVHNLSHNIIPRLSSAINITGLEGLACALSYSKFDRKGTHIIGYHFDMFDEK